jgi:DNA modification methylase
MNNMQPTWQTDDGAIRLYCADCLDVLPTLAAGSVDAVVSSPPYNTLPTAHKPSGLHGERKSGVNLWIAKAAKSYEDSMPEGEYQSWLIDVFFSCHEVCRGLESS